MYIPGSRRGSLSRHRCYGEKRYRSARIDGSKEFAITQTDDVHINGAVIVSAKGMYAELQGVAGQ